MSFGRHCFHHQYIRQTFVKRNLAKGAHFIVGDEFLPNHVLTNKEERADALLRYHGHIINKAKSENHPVLVQLENEALEAGLKDQGDFKLSCDQYEEYLSKAGLRFANPTKIGPQKPQNVGGIYVYSINLPANSD